MKLIKFKRDSHGYPEYGVVEKNRVRVIKNIFTISELFHSQSHGDLSFEGEIDLKDIAPLPPTDSNVHIYCAGLNYKDHAREMRMPLPSKPIFFTKSIGAISGARDDIQYPDETSLLDYEIELALVVGRRIDRNDEITHENLPEYVLGITIANDVSARDLQLTSGQWFMAKSFRSFAPIGPWVQILDRCVLGNLYNLSLVLQVYDSQGQPYNNKKQTGNTSDMVFKIHDLINALKNTFPLNPGDVISTGTPCGVALSRQNPIIARISEIAGLSHKKKTAMFIDREIKKNRRYLVSGDVIHSRIFSTDGAVDLGEQTNRIIKAV